MKTSRFVAVRQCASLALAACGVAAGGVSLSPIHARQDAYIAQIKIARAQVAKRFSVAQQKQIFFQAGGAEVRANKESMERYPINRRGMLPAEQAIALIAYSDKLKKRYKQAIMRNYRITRIQLDVIETDGITKHWPTPAIPSTLR